MNAKATQVGLMGGTFNPVHHGHLILARWVRETLDLDQVWLMPNRQSPLRMGEVLAPPEERLAWVREAVANEPGLSACDVEVHREGPSYLVETLEQLVSDHPELAFTFVMGADSLTTFHQWVRAERILELASIRVVSRPGTESEPERKALCERLPLAQGRVDLLTEAPFIDISATDIRWRVAEGRSIRYLVPDAVAERIEAGGFFG